MISKSIDINEKMSIFKFSHAGIQCGEFEIHDEVEYFSIWGVEIDWRLRGNGLGHIMMKECLEYLRNLGKYSKAVLYVDFHNDRAQKVYADCGFFFLDKSEYSFCYKMECIL